MKRLKLILISIIAFIILILFIFYSNIFQNFLAEKISNYFTNKYSLDIKIEKFRINLLPLQFKIDKLFISNASFIFTSDKIYIKFSYKIYLGKWQEFEEIFIDKPKFSLTQNSKNKNKNDSGTFPTIPSLLIRNLKITNGSLEFKNKSIPYSFILNNLNFLIINESTNHHIARGTAEEIKGKIKNIILPSFKAYSNIAIDKEKLLIKNLSFFNNESKINIEGKIIYQPKLIVALQEKSHIQLSFLKNQNIIKGTLKTISSFSYKQNKVKSKSEYEIENLTYLNNKIELIKGKFFLDLPQLKFDNIFCKYKNGNINLNALWNIEKHWIQGNANWDNLEIADFLKIFYPKIKKIKTNGELNFSFPLSEPLKGTINTRLEASSFNKNIILKLQADLKNKNIILHNSLLRLPGLKVQQNYASMLFKNANWKESEISASFYFTLENYSLLRNFLYSTIPFKFNKYKSYLSFIEDIKGFVKINYEGSPIIIKKGDILSAAQIRSRKLQPLFLSASTKLTTKKIIISELSLNSEGASLQSKGEILLNQPFWKEPLYINLSGNAADVDLASLKNLHPLMSEINGKLNSNFIFKGNLKKYLFACQVSSQNFKFRNDLFNELKSSIEINSSKVSIKELNIVKNNTKITLKGSYEINSTKFNLNFASTGNLKDIRALDEVLSSSNLCSKIANTAYLPEKINASYQANLDLYGNLKNINGTSNISLKDLYICDFELKDINIQSKILNSEVKFIASINSNELMIEGEGTLKKPYPFNLKAKISDSHLFNFPKKIFSKYGNTEVLITSLIHFQGNLTSSASFKIDTNIEKIEIKYNNFSIHSDEPFKISYNQEYLSFKNFKLISDNFSLEIEGKAYLLNPQRTTLSINANLNNAILKSFIKDISIQGTTSFNLTIKEDTNYPIIEGKISFESPIIEIPEIPFSVKSLHSDIFLEKNIATLSLKGSFKENNFSINGSFSIIDLIKLLIKEKNYLPADIDIEFPEVAVSNFYELPEEVNVILSGKAKISKISYLPNLIEGKATIKKFIFSAKDFSLQNTKEIIISIFDKEMKILHTEFEGADNKIALEGSLNLANQEINHINIVGSISIPLFATLLEGVLADGNAKINASIRGKLFNPIIQGNAKLEIFSAELKDYDVYGSNILLDLDFNSNVVNITKLTGEINGGEIKGEGSINFSNIAHPGFSINLKYKEGNISYPEGLNALANADLRISGSYPNILINGNIDILEAVFKKNIYPEQEALSSYLSKQIMKEEISPLAQKINLDIFCSLPENFTFSNNLANVNATGDIRLMGSLANPNLFGTLKISEGGSVKYAQKEFIFKRGDINFQGKYYWKPNIDVSLQRKERYNSVNYDINIEIKGDPDNLKINIWSQPPLPEKDIIKILAGQNPNQLANNLFTIFSGKYSGYGAEKLEKFLHLEEFKIEPLLVSNEVNPSARFTFGKSLTSQLFLTYSLSLSNSSNQTWIADYSLFKNFTLRALRRDDGTYNAAIRQFWQLGYQPYKKTAASSQPPFIKNIIIEGNTVFTKKELLNLIKFRKNEPYNFLKIKQIKEKIINYYQDKGYLSAKIVEKKSEVSEGSLDIIFTIEAKNKIVLTLNGKKIPNKFKNEIYKLYRQYLPKNFILKEAEKLILSSYYTKGYYEAKAKWQSKEINSTEFLDISVDKGIRYKAFKLLFQGNKVFKDKELINLLGIKKNLIFSEFSFNFEKHRDTILLAYNKLGYYRVLINQPEFIFEKVNKVAMIKINIQECPLAKIKDIIIPNNRLDKDKIIELTGIKIGDAFLIVDFQKRIERVFEYYKNKGYSGTQIDYEYKFDSSMNTYITLFIKEGEIESINKILITGNRITSSNLIKTQLLFKEGDKIDLEKFSASQSNLYKLGIFRKVRIYSQKNDKSQTIAYVEVEELPQYTFLYGLRYDNEKKLEVEGEFLRQNLFHYAHYSTFRFLWNDTQKDFRIGYAIPSFLKKDWRLDSFIFWRREFFSCADVATFCYPFYTQTSGISIQHSFKLSENLTFQYSYNFKQIHTWPLKEGQGFDFQINVARLSANLYGDYRNDKINPTKGHFYSIEAELSPKKIGSDLDFIKIFGQFFNYYPIKNKIIWASAVRIGLANAFGAILFYDERFFAGGGYSVRGYKLNSLGPINPFTNLPNGGEGLFILNEELRFPIKGILGGVLFYDAGNIYKEWQDFNPFKLRQSIGFGLRANTKFGLLRFDLGRKIKKKPGEKSYEIFFSLGHAF